MRLNGSLLLLLVVAGCKTSGGGEGAQSETSSSTGASGGQSEGGGSACDEAYRCETTNDCDPQSPETCEDGCCVLPPDPNDPEGTDDCYTSDEEDLDCPDDMDIAGVEGTCTEDTVTVRVTFDGGTPEPEPATSQSRQCEIIDATGEIYVVLTAHANAGPYSCSALKVEGGPPTGLGLGPGDSCGISADGEAFECVLTAATAGFIPTSARVSSNGDGVGDSAEPIELSCPW